MTTEQETALRAELEIDFHGYKRRPKWSERDSVNVLLLRARGLTIREVADVMRSSTRKVQDVLTGKA
jgi:hypothetical protein